MFEVHSPCRRSPPRQQDVRRSRYRPHRIRHGRLSRSSRTDAEGRHDLLRLYAKGDAKDLSDLHYSLNAEHTDTLHRLGQELFVPVSSSCLLVVETALTGHRQLFGPDDETDADALDKAATDGENRALAVPVRLTRQQGETVAQ